jgi:predicted signal transduction protein with EAL and GGDEF domain
VRGPDTVSRQGGDEFVVLLRELQNPEDAAATARRLLNAFADVHSIDQHEIRVTTSIGLSIYPSDAKDAEGLIRKADTAMYHAKKNGRHIYQFFKPEMTLDPLDAQSVERDLRHAKALEIELQSKGSPVHAHGRTMLSGIRQTATLNAGKHKGIRQKSRRAGTEEG